MLKIIEKDRKKIAILTLKGDPLGERDAELLRQTIRDVVNSNIHQAILEMSGVRHINSAGLGGLIAALHTMAKVGGSMQLTGIGPFVRNSFEITHLNTIFKIRESLDEAVNMAG